MKSAIVVLMLLFCLPEVCAMNIHVWTAPAALKLLEDAKPPERPSLDVRLAAARREYAAFQIVLRSDSDVRNVTASASPLTGPGLLGANRVTVWREHYVDTIEGRKPDPLSPLRGMDLKAGVAQPLYVEIEAPEDAKPGDYTGAVTILAGGQEAAKVKVRLHVHDFTLPLTPSLVTAFGLGYDFIPEFEGVTKGSKAWQKLREGYYEILLDHGISAYWLPADIALPESDRYLNDPRMTSYVIPYPADDGELKKLVDRLRAGGWLDRGYFYVVDEPFTKQSFEQIDAVVERLKRIVPDYRLVAPYFRNPDFDEKLTVYDMLKGRVNIWCYNTLFYDREALEERARAGEEVWNYVCCGPGRPYANFFVQMDAMDHRVLFWQEWKYGAEGLLYWHTNWWAGPPDGTSDPWEDMATIKAINKEVYGDGALLYPGRKVGHYGPLPSLRLKMIRLGMQDYEYIRMAADRAGRGRADAVVDSQAASWSEYQKDPVELDRAKEKLSAMIERGR